MNKVEQENKAKAAEGINPRQMTSFFGSIRSLFKGKEKPGQPTRISKYEDEIKLLLDTGMFRDEECQGGLEDGEEEIMAVFLFSFLIVLAPCEYY